MVKSFKRGAAVTLLLLSVFLIAAPGASASESSAPADAVGCTLTYIDDMNGPYVLPSPVQYVPPATVVVNGDPYVTFAVAKAFTTYGYVWCLL